MRTQILCLLALLPIACLQAQLTDDFSDGNFTANPAWAGSASSWTVNAAGQLQSANTIANSTYYLSTPNTLATSVQWEFSIRLQFSTSSANYTDVFLTASAADVTLPSTTGYFVRIGNTDDEVSLYRKDGGVAVKLIDGLDGSINKSDNTLKIKVIRDAIHTFTLYRDVSGTGNTYVSEGTVTDAAYTTTAYFGILVKQSTSSFFQKHFFDNISIAPYTPDVTPPSIQSLTVLSATSIDVLFDEPLEATSARTLANYTVNTIGAPSVAQQDAINPALVHLSFSMPFTSGATHTLTINGVTDVKGNVLHNGTATFSHYTPQRFDVVISEIMADPTPEVNLPNAEYIELKNTTDKTINLKGWRFTTATSASSVLPSYELPADSYLILTATSNVSLFPSQLRVLGLPSFPALSNTGTLLSLISKEGTLMHAVEYNTQWYNNPQKQDGGWSLEIIDTKNPCGGATNWKASTDASGGTPGQKNAIDGHNNDTAAPALIQASSPMPDTLVLLFNEPLDSLSAATIANYTIDHSITITSATATAPFYNKVLLKLSAPLQPGTIYTVKATNVLDCKGNGAGDSHTVQTGLPEKATAGDLVINEILFNPKSNGEDYIEVYNKSNKIIDAKGLYIANRNSAGAVASQKQLTETSFNIYPGQYIILTESKSSLQLLYHVKNPDVVLELATLPSYPDTEGAVVLLNQEDILDEVKYTDDWHFDLIADKEGVSLERIDPAGPSQEANNWHSAASTAGYGTPSYQNSQWKQTTATDAQLTIATPVFSPDNDGYDDVALIQYTTQEPGYVANISVFDTKGILVRHLVKNGTLGLKGSWTWDGLDEKKQKLPIGTYIIYTEFFNLQGKKERFKHTIVLARKN